MNPAPGASEEPWPLHAAASRGDAAAIARLLDAGFSPDARDPNGRTPLHFAARHGREACARLLIERGADPDARSEDGRSPVMTALSDADADREGAVLCLLLAAGVDPNGTDQDGATLLALAYEISANPTKILSLLEAGAQPDVKLQNDRTILHLTAAWDDEALVGPLLAAGADPARKDQEGRTPLHLACLHLRSNLPMTVRALLCNGAPADAPDHAGWTPLQLLCARLPEQRLDGAATAAAVRALKDAGADPARLDPEGKSPAGRLAEAREALFSDLSHSEILELIG